MTKIKNLFQKYFLYSIKSTINTLYLPIIIIFISISGWVSSMLATAQIEENAYKNVNDTIFQTKNYLDYMLSDVFQQLVSVSSNPRILNLVGTERAEIKPEYYVEIDKSLQHVYSRYNVIIESVLIDLNQGEFSLYHSDYNSNPSISYEDYFNLYEGSKEGFYWRNMHQDEIFNTNDQVISLFRLIERGPRLIEELSYLIFEMITLNKC